MGRPRSRWVDNTEGDVRVMDFQFVSVLEIQCFQKAGLCDIHKSFFRLDVSLYVLLYLSIYTLSYFAVFYRN